MGRSRLRMCAGIFNTSYREEHLNCQILVAEPECLEIMLTDPALSEWSKRIRHVLKPKPLNPKP
jgi:hypothetical protein